MKKVFLFLFVINLMLLQGSTQASALPNLDGKVENGEWADSETIDIQLTNGVTMKLSIIYTKERAYFLAEIPHNGPGDEIQLDPSQPHDYFGIEFDRNGDNAIHGSLASPDDMVLVNYFEKKAVDFYTHTFKVYEDTENGGRDDAEGTIGAQNGTIIVEFSKPLDSGDTNGYDINLKEGDTYQVMVAFWDDQPPHSADVFINRDIGGKIFFELKVGELGTDNTPFEIAFVAVATVVSGALAYFGAPKFHGLKNKTL
ncbi:MAG: hypothetical protein D6732_01425 [Methanobacteriota archaeon]|nr:MAG: hypothetical protein D6732_01425 [Euryarchaeota archaeon]